MEFPRNLWTHLGKAFTHCYYSPICHWSFGAQLHTTSQTCTITCLITPSTTRFPRLSITELAPMCCGFVVSGVLAQCSEGVISSTITNWLRVAS
eukprot:756204-Rhodomonas_salina.1